MTTRQSGSNEALRSFDKPDEHGQFDHGECRIVSMQGREVGLLRLQKGFRYSDAFGDQPSDRQPHIGYIVRGTLYVQDPSGEEFTAEVNKLVTLNQGDDYWTDQDTEMIDLTNPREFITSSR